MEEDVSDSTREAAMVVLRRDEDGKATVWCDPEIADLVDALNNSQLATVASCSGHGHRPGRISLADGRELFVAAHFEQADLIDRNLPLPDINGVTTHPRRPTMPDKGGTREYAVLWDQQTDLPTRSEDLVTELLDFEFHVLKPRGEIAGGQLVTEAASHIRALEARVGELEGASRKARKQIWSQREKADDTLRQALENGK